ncbi:MAG: TIGR03936 family radical SAM-associated protein [Christensenellales bacterium]|jgi:radical SAM-linked protein
MRLLIRFGKKARLRFISHLDLQRFFQRALNRADLPVAYSQGFSPHPIMAFSSALALGWTSEYEVLDIRLASPVDLSQAQSAMAGALPSDLPVIEARLVEDSHPAMMPLVKMAEYSIANSQVTADDLSAFLAAETVMAVRKTKTREREINIRPLADEVYLDGSRLFARLMLTEQDTLKPDLLLSALTGRPIADARIHRVSLLGTNADGARTPIMRL